MFLFVTAIILLLISGGVTLFAFSVKSDPKAPFGGIMGGATAVAALGWLLVFLSCVAVVGTKNVGVLTTFGHPDGYLSNGFHLTAPWQSVTELDDAVQTDTYASDGGAAGHQQGGAVGTCIAVRIARQGTACVNVSARWQIKPSGVDYLFRNFHDNNSIQDNLVLRDLQTAMNQAFSSYDPLGIDTEGLSTNKPLGDMATAVRDQLRSEIGQWIDISSISIPLLNFDPATQDKINQLQQQVAATRVAAQAVLTAKSQAEANQVLAASVGHDPNVLTDKCLNILKEAVDKGQALPAGFSCFTGSSATVAVH